MTRRKRSNLSRRGLWFLIVLVILVATFIVGQSWYQATLNQPLDSVSEKRVKFTVDTGDTARDIVSKLENNDLIRAGWPVLWHIKQNDLDTQIKTGTYVLSPSQSATDMIAEMVNPTTSETWITIIEGWTNHDIAEYLADRNFGSYEEIITCAETCELEQAVLDIKPADASLEGFLYPDSYIVTHEYTPKNIMQKMVDNFAAKFTPELRAEAEATGYIPYEVLIMASMVEKEVRGLEDKKIVSGILWKRLENNIPLGVDATVLYARGYWEGPITQSDLRLDSPYNTRLNTGLPPGPICNPSLESIKAAIYPTETEYLFYITEPEAGEVIYARDLEEHNRNVNQYLR